MQKGDIKKGLIELLKLAIILAICATTSIGWFSLYNGDDNLNDFMLDQKEPGEPVDIKALMANPEYFDELGCTTDLACELIHGKDGIKNEN